jgi:hypothetical protein
MAERIDELERQEVQGMTRRCPPSTTIEFIRLAR